jgi:phage tail tape-measure protein
MAPMYDEDESIWTGAGLSKEIARQRLAERQSQAPEASGVDRAVGAMKGAAGGASTGASLGSMGGPMGTAIGTGIGALVGGIGGAVTASPSEKAPTASQIEQGVSTAKKAYK